ncbi:unnamed protein product, partial [marine sediment metagenome]
LIFAGPADKRSYYNAVKRLAFSADITDSVVFAGTVIAELRQLYGLAKVIAFPSLQENSPLAVLEAMAQGKAIVASDIAPLREMLPAGTAELVSPLDHEALAKALIRLLRDDSAREELGARARQRAYDVYRWEKVASRIVEAYERLTRRPAEPARGVG